METSMFLEAIREDLAAVAGDDPAVAAVADRLARALEPSLLLRLLDAMGQAAAELSDQDPSGHVEVRLAGRDVRFVHVPHDELASNRPVDEEDGGTARLTLRMSDGLKSRVEQAADREGLSTNAWLVRTISRGLDRPAGRRVGSRITGFAQG